jgi:ribonuclease HI
MIEIYFDGAAEPTNPGIGTYGFVIYKNGKRIQKGKGALGDNISNNQSEYTALIKAIECLIEEGLAEVDDNVLVHGDSQLVIRQMQGRYSVNAERIIPLYKKASTLVEKIRRIQFKWIPREENEEADTLSHRAYTEYIEEHPEAGGMPKIYLATPKQKAFMDRLHIKYDKYISKREASRLISTKIKEMG